MTRRPWFGLVAALVITGCVDEGGVEDPIDDAFMTADAKADAFGVEDWSPDGMAVLRLVNSASARKLEDDVGLSARAAKSVVAHRATLDDGRYRDLAELDAAPYIGRATFARLIQYVTDEHLYRTAIRVPLVTVDPDAARLVPISSFNDEAQAAGKRGFASYTFVDEQNTYFDKAASYNERLAELGLDRELVTHAVDLSALAAGSLEPCYVGDPMEVPDLVRWQADDLLTEMYTVRGWRTGEEQGIADDVDTLAFGAEWADWAESSAGEQRAVGIWYVYDDGVVRADDETAKLDVLPPCR